MIELEQTLIAQARQNLSIITRLCCSTANDDERREFSEAWGAFYGVVELALCKSGISQEAALVINDLASQLAKTTAQLQTDRAVRVEDEIQRLLNSPDASHWLKHSLESALARDCVDAANDADVLHVLLAARCE